jgi:hypothetical protein
LETSTQRDAIAYDENTIVIFLFEHKHLFTPRLDSLQAAKMIVLKDLRSAKTALAELATLNSIFHSQKKGAHDVVMKDEVRRVGWQSVSDSTAIPKVLEQLYPTLCK